MSRPRDTDSAEAAASAATPDQLGLPMESDPEPVQGRTGTTAGAGKQVEWTWAIWRFIPPFIVLATVVYIVISLWDQLQANHWAYPALLAFVGLLSLLMVLGALPRRHVDRTDREPRLEEEWSGPT